MTESISSHEQAASEASVSYWRLVTNHENMLFMLAAGMVMSPAGFGQKYYKDTLKVESPTAHREAETAKAHRG